MLTSRQFDKDFIDGPYLEPNRLTQPQAELTYSSSHMTQPATLGLPRIHDGFEGVFRPQHQQQQQHYRPRQLPSDFASGIDHSEYGLSEPEHDREWPVSETDIRLRLEQVIATLDCRDPAVQANSARLLQHLVYKNPEMKELTRRLNGINMLVQLIYADSPSVYTPVLETLRNLSNGDNAAIKNEIVASDGIRSLAWHIENRQVYVDPARLAHQFRLSADQVLVNYDPMVNEEVQPSMEAASTVLLQLASQPAHKEQVMREALIPSLVTHVLQPVATQAVLEASGAIASKTNAYTGLLFCNIASIVRSLSSSDSAEVRASLRNCEGLLPSLLSVLRAAIDGGHYEVRAVELCVCTIRNLCFALQEIVDPAYTARKRQRSRSRAKRDRSTSRSIFGRSSSRNARRDASSDSRPNGSTSFLNEQSVSLLWRRATLVNLLALLKNCSNPVTLEAAASAIQNLTAGDWEPSAEVCTIIREEKGLQVLVALLGASVQKVACSAASALRNLCMEEQTRQLLGEIALRKVVSLLPDEARLQQAQADQLSLMLASNEWSSNSTVSPTVGNYHSFVHLLLCLSHDLITEDVGAAKSFVDFGGVPKCRAIRDSVDDELLRNSRRSSSGSLRYTKRGSVHSTSSCGENSALKSSLAAKRLLQLLWSFKQLHDLFKARHLLEADFLGSRKSGRFGHLLKKRPESRRSHSSDRITASLSATPYPTDSRDGQDNTLVIKPAARTFRTVDAFSSDRLQSYVESETNGATRDKRPISSYLPSAQETSSGLFMSETLPSRSNKFNNTKTAYGSQGKPLPPRPLVQRPSSALVSSTPTRRNFSNGVPERALRFNQSYTDQRSVPAGHLSRERNNLPIPVRPRRGENSWSSASQRPADIYMPAEERVQALASPYSSNLTYNHRARREKKSSAFSSPTVREKVKHAVDPGQRKLTSNHSLPSVIPPDERLGAAQQRSRNQANRSKGSRMRASHNKTADSWV